MLVDAGYQPAERFAVPTPRRKSLRRLSSTRGFKPSTTTAPATATINEESQATSGWIRVHEGPEPFTRSAQSRLVRVTSESTVSDVNDELGLDSDLTLWIQVGGGDSRPLDIQECPLVLQETWLLRTGWKSRARRARLAVDPELRHALRWHAGPLRARGGTLHLLKGLVFPQWKNRAGDIVGSRLHIQPASPEGETEVLELLGGDVELCPPKGQKLVLRVRPEAVQMRARDANIFLGFNTFWERNLWFCWLKKATLFKHPTSNTTTIILVPDTGRDHRKSIANGKSYSEGCGDVGVGGRELRLGGAGLARVPPALCHMRDITLLDLSDNLLQRIPDELKNLTMLEELIVSGNSLRALGGCVRPPRLRTLRAARNAITSLTDMDEDSDENSKSQGEEEEVQALRVPLTTVDLRENRLKGSIILGNYEHLAELDVSSNSIERLRVGALRGLRELRCATNRLVDLELHGAQLTILQVNDNDLEGIVCEVPPANLIYLDVGHNRLRALPAWLASCRHLATLRAAHNQLTDLPDHIFCTELSSLTHIDLSHNRIKDIPTIPRLRSPLKELLLHNNCLLSLPDNFFSACDRLIVLNLSNNRLIKLPSARAAESFALQKLYLTANCFEDSVVELLIAFRSLRVLHIAYNCLANLNDNCVSFWPDLVDLVLSGNRLQKLPDNLPRLRRLKVLRAHSNRLQSAPMFANNTSIKVLDLAHNELDVINLNALAPKQLKFLDISCNKRLQVDPTQFHSYRCQRPMSLIDVSGHNRPALPWQQRQGHTEDYNYLSPWKLGFSETPGENLSLCVSQLRQPMFCNREGLFAIIDGENDSEIPNILKNSLPTILLEEKTIKETANEYLRYVILSAHRDLKEQGQKNGACLVVCHIALLPVTETGFAPTPKRYILRMANVGNTKAVLSRRSGPLCLGSDSRNRVGYSSQFPHIIPDPEITQTALQDDDEFLIIGNKQLWDTLTVESAVDEVRSERNPILAAKRLQDLAQSYGAEGSISVMIVRFDNACSDVDLLMRELRQTIRNNKSTNGCCCDHRVSCCHSMSLLKPDSDRSSPSGQSDQATELAAPITPVHYSSVRSNTKVLEASRKAAERRSCRGVARAIRVRVEEEKDTREREQADSSLSEEQFKCWEYMLEQNTQLLFDKELDTLSKGFSRRAKLNGLRNLKGLSGSSPQLTMPEHDVPVPGRVGPPFLSKHFGSARSFVPAGVKPDMRFASGRVPNGGPNAAYFGSLQRLMPYHLEYDFAVIQERAHQSQDSLDLEGRMHQYWGVATTEL